MPGVTNAGQVGGGVATAQPPAHAFKSALAVRVQGFREAAGEGDLPTGSVWLVRLLEAGQSLNGPVYLAESVKAAAPVFEGAPVYHYSFTDPADGTSDHVPNEVQEAAPGGLVGNQVGSLEGVHWNEEAQALDGFLKLYDAPLREKFLAAYQLGDIGEGGSRDTFGLSIDAYGDTNDEGEVIRFTAANSVDVVSTPAAGGRIRRLVAALQAKQPQKEKPMPAVALKESATHLREAGSDLMQHATQQLVFETAMDMLRDVKWDDDLSAQDKATRIAQIANDLAEVMSGMRAVLPAGGAEAAVQESVAKKARFVEAAATFAGKLKLMADALSAAPDDQAGTVLAQIKEAVDEAISVVATGTDSDQAAEEAAMPKPKDQGQAAQQDEFARMSAGLTEALKRDDLSPATRKALVEALGHDPGEAPEQAEIRKLQEQLRNQAIQFALTQITSLKENRVHDQDLVLTLLDKSMIKVNDKNEVSGLKEAFDALLEAKPFLRVTEAAAPAPTAGDGQGQQSTDGQGAGTGVAGTNDDEGGQQQGQQQQESQGGDGATGNQVGQEQGGQQVRQDGAPLNQQQREALQSGVQLRESFQGKGKVTKLTDAKKARLRKRALNGDPDAMTQLRHARGHRW